MPVSAQSQPDLRSPTPESRSTRHAALFITTTLLDNPPARDKSTNLVYLQAIILLAVEAGNRPPATESQGIQRSLTYSSFLGLAVGLAYAMKLHETKIDPEMLEESGNDLDREEERLARSMWWTLVIMDRWHSMSRSTPVLIPDGCIVAYPEDKLLLGPNTYHLARKSYKKFGIILPSDLMPRPLRRRWTPCGCEPSSRRPPPVRTLPCSTRNYTFKRGARQMSRGFPRTILEFQKRSSYPSLLLLSAGSPTGH